MEWLKELLQEKGVADDVIEEVITSAQEKMNQQRMIPKHRFDEVNEAKKQLEEQLAERDKQLTELKKSVGDNEELRKQIESLQAENKAKEEEYQARIRDLSITTAIKLAVAGEAHDPDLVANLLDKSKIEVDEEGNIKGGLDDQLNALRESKAFLFVQKTDPQPKFKGVQPLDGREKADTQPQPKSLAEAVAAFYNNKN